MDEHASGAGSPPPPLEVADRLHSAAIHLLRRLRRQDPASGLSAPRLSALSVIVFGGPLTMSELAAAEQVRLPTVSRLITSLEGDGLVRREVDPGDRRVVRVRATPAGERVLEEGRTRRIGDLSARLQALSSKDLATLSRATGILEAIAASPDRPAE